MNGDVIKSFLVGLGFGVDDASLKKFNRAIASATLKVTALYTSTKLMAAGVVYGISKISEGFEQMGYEYRIIAPAINKALMLRRELLKAYSAAGINITKVIQSSVKLNFSLAKTKFAFEAIYRSVASKFFDQLTKSSDMFRQKIYANLPKIQAALERLVKFTFKALEATTTLGLRLWSILTRVYDFFIMLDRATNGWSTVILGVIAAWKLLNLSFLATPLGMIITGLVAILALFDDFKTFQEGGHSLINWGSDTTKMILGVTTAVAGLAAVIGGVIFAIKAWAIAQYALNLAMSLNPIGLIILGVTALLGLLTALAVKFGYLKGVTGFFQGLGEKVMNFVGEGNVAANLQNLPGGVSRSAPLGVGGNTSNSLTNQNVNQQTNISISGVADANGAAAAVDSRMTKQNFDLVRNLKPRAR